MRTGGHIKIQCKIFRHWLQVVMAGAVVDPLFGMVLLFVLLFNGFLSDINL